MRARLLALCALAACVLATAPLAQAAPAARPGSGGGGLPGAVPRHPALLRVGLATDLARVELPCCDLALETEGGALRLGTAITVLPDAASTTPPVFRVQVAALKDEAQAAALAARLGRELGVAAEAVFDAATDLYKVRVGRFADRHTAESAQRRLAVAGVAQSWIASEPGSLGDPGLGVEAGGGRHRVAGRWASFSGGADGTGISAVGGRYRGRILVYLNDRGSLNVVNELSLDDYLRGVVPREMGPDVYPSLEALKAQTVAARTYTLRNLAEFGGEGYDICATPRCQVYGGLAAERPLSNRAIDETGGEVLVWNGELVDALYSSTCGGHTEDVRFIFPRKDFTYLKGVPCGENGGERLAGAATPGTPFPAGLTRMLLPPAGGEAAAELGRRLGGLADLAELARPPDRLASLARGEVRRFLASAFDLALDLRLLRPAPEVSALLRQPPPQWGGGELRLAGHLIASGLLDGDDESLAAAEGEALLLEVALYLGALTGLEGRYLELERGAGGASVLLGAGGLATAVPLAGQVATFRPADARLEAADLELQPGDPLTLYLRQGSAVAVVQPRGGAPRRPIEGRGRGSWTRFRSDGELSALVATRYPGLGFSGFEILERGVSGRVSRIRLHGAAGRSAEVEGLAVRWTLDLPDTWFTAERAEQEGRRGWLFHGRGWGHGVGMCQVGAYAMAQRGLTYRDILEHYYSGTAIGRLDEERPVTVAAP